MTDTRSTTEADDTAICPYGADSEPCHSQRNNTITDPEPALHRMDDDDSSVEGHSDEGVKAIHYARPSDLCRGAWMLFKCEESDWHLSAFLEYFAEGMPPRFPAPQKGLTQRSPLSQAQSINDLSDDEDLSMIDAAEVITLLSKVPHGSQAEVFPHERATTAEVTKTSSNHGAAEHMINREDFAGPCGHIRTIGPVNHEEQAVEKLLCCGIHRRDGLLADCRLAAVEELRAEGSLKAGGDARARRAEDWVRTAWPAAWGVEARLTEPDGRSCFLDTGETAVPREYRGEKNSSANLWEDDDEE